MKAEQRISPSIGHDGGPFGTVPELLFKKKQLMPALQQLLVLL
jgi:hypothetical protein